MQGSSEFSHVKIGTLALRRMPLPQLCELLSGLKARRDAAMRASVERSAASEQARLRAEPVPSEQAAARLHLTRVEQKCQEVAEWAARLIAEEETLDPDLSIAAAWGTTPAGTSAIVGWALAAAGKTLADVAAASVLELQAAARDILHLAPADPTAAGAASAASPALAPSGTSASSESTPAATATGSS